MLVARDRERFRLAEALFWSVTWGVGAALGVALGGWLTLVGGSGAPGTGALDVWTDLVILPVSTFVVVVVIHLCGQLIAGAVRGRTRENSDQQ